MDTLFSDAEVAINSTPTTRRCARCGLHRGCQSARMEATGEGEKGVLVLAEAPGAEEDRTGVQLVGKAGQFLRKALSAFSIDLDRDCRKMNAVNCRPPKNRTPDAREVECCRAMVWDEIKRFKPRVIIALGGTAVESLVGHRWKRDLGGVGKWRGWCIPDVDAGAWICPTYHPSYIMRHTTDEVAELVFRNDLEQALLMDRIPVGDLGGVDVERGRVELIHRSALAVTKLRELRQLPGNTVIGLDYETTGLKPHRKGHRIVSCAIAPRPSHAFAFLVTPEVEWALVDLLEDERVGKVAANMKFEEAWSRHCLETEVRGWRWDTMLAAHALDNRSGITSVKFQTYVQLGIPDYDSHLSALLKGTKNDANSFNHIQDIPVDELLVYNGLDAMFELRIAHLQASLIGVEL